MAKKRKIELIPDWKKGWRFMSTQIGAIGLFVSWALLQWPDTGYEIWLALPNEVRSVIPEQYVKFTGAVIFAISMVARFVKQRKLDSERQKHEPESKQAD